MPTFAPSRPIEALLKHSPLKADRIEGTDLVIFRELTGGIYFGEKGRTADGTAYDNCTYSRPEIERIAHLAFQSAAGRRQHLTLVDKANVLETSRLWREVVREIVPAIPRRDG
ncbi:MAG: isocitrate/isopropylmalate family dehydrogenase [Hymenobacter sp.]